jgi:peptidoglycan DL-endopeptidase LytF
MNNPSPLLPQGSLLEQKNRGRARVKIAVFVVLAIHGIGLLALLMQGCKKEPEAPLLAPEQPTNTATEAAQPPPPPPVDTNLAPVVTNPLPPAPETNPLPPASPTTYKVVQGDTLSTIAKKFHVSLNALMAANPGVEPTRLQIGQTLQIPPPVPAATTGGLTSAPAVETSGGETIYTVKSGDTLSSIANHYKVTVRAIESANNLTTTRIRVGQKLKIPVKPETNTGGATTSAPAATPPGQ